MPEITLRYYDAAHNDLLETQFLADDFTVYNSDTSFLLPKTVDPLTEDYRIYFDILGFDSGVPYYLQLDSTETDSIIINWSVKEEQCWNNTLLDNIV